jgi:hypothetical protein
LPKADFKKKLLWSTDDVFDKNSTYFGAVKVLLCAEKFYVQSIKLAYYKLPNGCCEGGKL